MDKLDLQGEVLFILGEGERERDRRSRRTQQVQAVSARVYGSVWEYAGCDRATAHNDAIAGH